MDRLSIITLAAAKAYANKKVEALEQVVRYIGVTTTKITDGSTTNPITINGQSVTAVAGDTVFYNGTSYAWDGSAWQEVMNIAEIITAVEELGGKIHDILADIAPEFDSTETYSVDDVVLYEDDLYIFTAEHTGAWDSADVDVTSLANIIEDIRTELSDKQDALPLTFSGNDITTNGSLFAGNDIIDGQGNTLSVLAEALTKTASGNPITITDCAGGKARSLKTTIEAIQDLHGYDKPWAGGAGKNIYVGSPSFDGYYNRNLYQLASETYNGHEVIYKSEAWSGVYKEFTVKAGVTYTFSAMVKCAESANVRIFNRAAETLASQAIGTSWTRITATFTPSADTVERLRVESSTDTTIYLSEYQLEVGSTATSYAPYSNICPISGRTEVRVDDTGKNQLPLDIDTIKSLNTSGAWNGNAYTVAGITFTVAVSNGKITDIDMNGTTTATITLNLFNATNPLNYNGKVLSGFTGGSGGTGLRISDNVVKSIYNYSGDTDITGLTDTGAVAVVIRVESGKSFNHSKVYPMIRPADTSADFEPYAHSSATIQLGQTVYGGSLNVKTGVLTIDRAIVDMGSMDWAFETWANDMYSDTLAIMILKPVSSIVTSALCTIFKAVSRDDIQTSTNAFCVNIGGRVIIVDPRYTDAAQFKTAVTGEKICYPLATPITLQLTPTQLELLKGYNMVSSNGTTIYLTYSNNPNETITLKVNKSDIAPTEGATASRAYAVNEFMFRGDTLYKVTQAIASGASITDNNTTRTTIGAVLTALLNA